MSYAGKIFDSVNLRAKSFKLIINHLSLIIIIALAMMTVSCEDKGGTGTDPRAASYIALAGSWQLAEMEGVPVADEVDMYVVLERRALEGAEAMGWRPYQIYSNDNSAEFRQTTGLFMLKITDYDEIYITGLYDHGVGNDYYWYVDYFVALSSDRKTMTWTEMDEYGNPDPKNTRKFNRIASVPSEITDLFPVEEDEE